MNFFNLHNIKTQAIIVLTILILAGAIQFGPVPTILQAVVAVGVAVGLDLAIFYAKNRRFFPATSAIITGLIISLVLSIDSSLVAVALASVIAILSKNFLRFESFGKKRHILNPSAAGIFAVSLVPAFKLYANGWWGDLYPYLMLALGGYILWKQRRISQVVIFIISLAFLTLIGFVIQYHSIDLWSAYIGGLVLSLLFFSSIMLIEPQTNPLSHQGRIIFAVVCAAAIFISGFMPFLAAPLVFALLLSDLTVPWINQISIPKTALNVTKTTD